MSVAGARSTIAVRAAALSPVAGGSTMSVLTTCETCSVKPNKFGSATSTSPATYLSFSVASFLAWPIGKFIPIDADDALEFVKQRLGEKSGATVSVNQQLLVWRNHLPHQIAQ